MDEIVPGLWVGGLTSALSLDYLTQAGITHIITCMKQRLPPPAMLLDGRTIPPSNIRQVRVDDVEQAPILAHFTSCNEFIADVLKEQWIPSDDDYHNDNQVREASDGANGDGKTSSPASGQKVAGELEQHLLVQDKQKRYGKWGNWQTMGEGTLLIHCQAGCSRSVAITAAYLMHTRRITTHEAVKLIQARRARAQPNAGFMAQLELYEQVGYEVDMRHQAVRRFLMSKTDILNGDSFDDMLLSYYPSPYPSPALSQGLKDLSTISSPSSGEDGTDLGPAALEDDGGDGKGSSNSSSDLSSPGRDPRGSVSANAVLSTSPTMAQMGDHFSHLSAGPSSSSDGDGPVRSSSTTISQPEEVRVTKNSGRLPGGVLSIKGHEGLSNRGQLPKPTFCGPKLRCKACRRELAALDHIIEHREGQRQMAFEHRKREGGNAKYADQTRVTNISSSSSAAVGSGTEEEEKFGARPSVVRKVVDDDEAPATTESSTSDLTSSPPSATSASAPATRRIQSASSLTSRLPPHLAALRSRPSSSLSQSRPAILHSTACSAYFIEPMAWMSSLESGEVSGKLACPAPKCASKLGSWDWAGMQCGCGAWVTPAFALHRSKVDEV